VLQNVLGSSGVDFVEMLRRSQVGVSPLAGSKNALNIAIKRASEPILEKASKRLPKGRQCDIRLELDEIHGKQKKIIKNGSFNGVRWKIGPHWCPNGQASKIDPKWAPVGLKKPLCRRKGSKKSTFGSKN